MVCVGVGASRRGRVTSTNFNFKLRGCPLRHLPACTMACTRYEAASNIRAEAARLEALVDGQAGDHGRMCTELDQSNLALWISTWLGMVEKDAGAGLRPEEVLWVSAVCRACTRLVETTAASRTSDRRGGSDAEPIRLFVNDLIKGHVLPCVEFAARAVREEAGVQRAGAEGDASLGAGSTQTSQPRRLFSELIGCLRAVGTSSARYIADPRAVQSKGMNKLANTTWAGVYDGYHGQAEGLRDREGMAGCLGNLMELIECCFVSMADGNLSEEGYAAASKALKFLVSNYGRLVVLLGGTSGGHGAHDASKGTWVMIRPSAYSLWQCLVGHAAAPAERDPFHGVALAYKAVALTFEHAPASPKAAATGKVSRTGEAEGELNPWWILDEAKVSRDELQVIANVMVVASEKMSKTVLEKLIPTVGRLVGHLSDACIQQGVTESTLADVEVGILEYLSRCLDADPNVFKRALYTLMSYLLRPHPLVEEMLCRVVAGVMEWGSEGLQRECVAMISDMLSRAVSCDDDLGLSPGVEQGVNVLATAMMVGGESVSVRVAEDWFPSRRDGAPQAPSTSHQSPTVASTVDVFEVARLAVFMRAMGLCRWAPSFSTGVSRQGWMREQLHRIAAVWRMRPVGDDCSLLMAWTAECLFHASKLVASGPLVSRKGMNGTSNGVANGRAKGAADDGTEGGALRTAIDSLAGRLVLSSSPSCPRLQRVAVMLDLIYTHTPFMKRGRIEGLDAALDAFDKALPTAGWLVGLAATQVQRPTSRMRRIYGQSLDEHATLPLQYLAMHSYKDYVSFSDSDEAYGVEAGGDQALDVLPSCRIVGGSISADFKARLTPYLVGLEYGHGLGDGGVDPNANTISDGLGPALASAARALEDGFRRNLCSKRVHRQNSCAGGNQDPSQDLRGIATALRGWGDRWRGQHDGGSEEEIAAIVRQMKLELEGILRTLSV